MAPGRRGGVGCGEVGQGGQPQNPWPIRLLRMSPAATMISRVRESRTWQMSNCVPAAARTTSPQSGSRRHLAGRWPQHTCLCLCSAHTQCRRKQHHRYCLSASIPVRRPKGRPQSKTGFPKHVCRTSKEESTLSVAMIRRPSGAATLVLSTSEFWTHTGCPCRASSSMF